MAVFPATDKNIYAAAEVLKNGGLVAFPTETVYGLGANGLNPVASAKIFEAKERPAFNPLILHLPSIEEIGRYCFVDSPDVHTLAEKFWPGPLTLVLRKKEIVPDIITAGNPTVAVRMPDHPVAHKLISLTGKPVAAPSANRFGFLSPTEAYHVEDQLGERVDMILDGGKTAVGVESTILAVDGQGISLLRHGGLSAEEIEQITGPLKTRTVSERPDSPGQLLHHYSPAKPLYLINDKLPENVNPSEAGLLAFSKNWYDVKFGEVRILSKAGDMREAAANLFSYLHELEDSGVKKIYAETVKEEGLGRAIMDRLRRAAQRYL